MNLRRLSRRFYRPLPLTTRALPRSRRNSRGGRGAAVKGRSLGQLAQALGFGQPLQLLQGVVLDLADPLAGDAERLANLLERSGVLPPRP